MNKNLTDKELKVGMIVRHDMLWSRKLVRITDIEECPTCKFNHYYTRTLDLINSDSDYHTNCGSFFKANTQIK